MPLPDYRPRYHFAAARHWINDPNGLLCIDGLYHLFYQCNPFGTEWGNMSWGHAVSRDLVQWEERPIALPQRALAERTESIFSGCCVLDRDNVSGLGQGGKAPLLAFYTSHYSPAPAPMGRQAQSLAYSLDEGDSWQFYGEEPLIHLHRDNADGFNANEFRDPRVFYYEPGGYWVMLLVLALDRKVIFYRSHDLLHWEMLSTFDDPGANPKDLWEVPDLVEMPIEGSEASRWVLLLGVNTHGPHLEAGSTQHYFIGDFDGREFVLDEQATAQYRDGEHPGHNRLDWGRDFYAAVTFHNAPGREPLALAWMNNWSYANAIPHQGFRGQMTLARRLWLRQVGERLQPIAEPVRLPLISEQSTMLVPEHALSQREALKVRLSRDCVKLSLRMPDFRRGRVELCLHFGPQTLQLSLDADRSTAVLDRSGLCGDHVPAGFAARDKAQTLQPESWSVDIYLDSSSVEVFGSDGSWSITQQIFPLAPVDSITVGHTQPANLSTSLEVLQ